MAVRPDDNSVRLTMAQIWALFEFVVGIFSVFVLGFAVPVITFIFALAFLMSQFMGDPGDRADPLLTVGLCTAFLATSIPAAWLVWIIAKVHSRFFPERSLWRWRRVYDKLPLAIAHRASRAHWLFMIPLSILWFAHFSAGWWLRDSIDQYFTNLLPQASQLTRSLAISMTQFGFAFACNIYFLLAVAVLFRSRVFTRYAWESRLLMDIVAAAIALVI
jgi:hypothetical protein